MPRERSRDRATTGFRRSTGGSPPPTSSPPPRCDTPQMDPKWRAAPMRAPLAAPTRPRGSRGRPPTFRSERDPPPDDTPRPGTSSPSLPRGAKRGATPRRRHVIAGAPASRLKNSERRKKASAHTLVRARARAVTRDAIFLPPLGEGMRGNEDDRFPVVFSFLFIPLAKNSPLRSRFRKISRPTWRRQRTVD